MSKAGKWMLAIFLSGGAMAGGSWGKAASCDEIRAAKTKVYGFHVAQLNDAELDAKGREIEAFWNEVDAAGQVGTDCIRGMLKEEKNDHMFQFDAASALAQKDKSAETLKLVREAALQADFQETDPASYLALGLLLAHNGVDVAPLGEKVLRYPNAVIRVPEHALDLDTDTAALFLYGSMPVDEAVKALIPELQAPEASVRAGAAHLLAEMMTPEALAALSAWEPLKKVQEDYRRNDIQSVLKYQAPKPGDLENPKYTREQVLTIIGGLPHTQEEMDRVLLTKGEAFDKEMRDKRLTQEQIAAEIAAREPLYGIAGHTEFLRSAVATLKPEDLSVLREARRKSQANLSDESLNEYLAYTQILIGLMNRMTLYKESRIS